MTDPRLIIFDVDGTLIDSRAAIVGAMSEAFAEVGQPAPARADILGVVGLSLPVLFGRLMQGADGATQAHAAAAYRAAFGRAMSAGAAAAPLFPGAREMLEALSGEPATLLGVATGKSRRGLGAMLEAHQLGRYFHTTQTADDHPSKPHPSMVLACLAETGVDPARAVIVGDTDFDIDMGRAAGIGTIGVTWGYHPAERLRAAGADRLIDSFDVLHAAPDDISGRAP